MTSGGAAARRDLFISYTGADRPWAEWAGTVLEQAGYTVELDRWDWSTGDNVVLRMNDALARADRVLSIWSPAYFERERFTTDEWTAVLADRPGPDGQRGRLIPIRVSALTAEQTPPVLRPLLYRDIQGMHPDQARDELLSAVAGPTGRGDQHPYPGSPTAEPATGTRPPGSRPRVWQVPLRNQAFTGRQSILAELREALTGQTRVRAVALRGIGGIGKTQTAIEYAHLFASSYEQVWWIDAEHPERVPEQLTTLAITAGWTQTAGATIQETARITLEHLRRSTGWLLLFDNVEDPASLREWLPGTDTGHVILTTRGSAQPAGITSTIDVSEFTRSESIGLLREHQPSLSDADASIVAGALGDLPLAIATAAGLIAETGITAPEFLDELTQHASDLLEETPTTGYPNSVAAATRLTLTKLAEQAPAAADVLHIAAVLAPDPIPLTWFTTISPGHLPPQLAAITGATIAFRRATARITDLGLARPTIDGGIQVHRLTQAVIRDTRTPEQLDQDRRHAITLVISTTPTDDGNNPTTWAQWARILPHMLSLNPTTHTDLTEPALRSLRYLNWRGDYAAALTHAETYHQHWHTTLGPDHPTTLTAANILANTYHYLAHHQHAHDLYQTIHRTRLRILSPDHPDTLHTANDLATLLSAMGRRPDAHDLYKATHDARQRVLGPDHPDTLNSAHNLASSLGSLGRHQDAYTLQQATHEARLRVLGPDHPDTLTSASGLAFSLGSLGRHQDAYTLQQATHEARLRVLGPDHPATLASASGLAADLGSLGCHQDAYTLHQATYDAYQRVLGPDHPDTLTSATGLAVSLGTLGRYQDAHTLQQATHEARLRVLGPHHPATLASAGSLAANLGRLSHYQDAYTLQQATHEARLRVLGPDHPDTLASASSLAALLSYLGRYEDAHTLQQATHNACQRVLGPDHPATLASASSLAANLGSLGRHQDAYTLHQATHDAYQRVLGPDHPDTLNNITGLAVSLGSLGRHQDAYTLHQATHEAFLRVFGPDHPATVTSAHDLAASKQKLEHQMEAQARWQATLAKSLPPPNANLPQRRRLRPGSAFFRAPGE